MKILIYSPAYRANSGGLENMTLLLANYFRESGNEVDIISHQSPLLSNKIDWVYYTPSFSKQISLFLACDIFYMPNISLKGIWLLLFNPFKVWVISHNGWYGNYSPKGSKTILERLKIKLSTKAKNIAVSKTVAEYLKIQCEVIPNCFNHNIFYLRPQVARAKTVVFVGRLVSDKGIDTLLKACDKLWSAGMQFQLHIIGDGPELNWIQSFIADNSNGNKIVLHGYISGNILGEELNRHKLLIAPSKCPEGFGLVVLEGLSSGCQVIVSDMGALPEVVGEFGKIFPSGNVDSLAQLIKNELFEPELNQDPAQVKLKEYLNIHSIENIGKAYLNVFRGKGK